MKKILHIGLCIINILLIVDLFILAVLGPIIPESILMFWFQPFYVILQNDNNFLGYILLADMISKIVVLALLIILIVRHKQSRYNYILLKIILILYGVFLIYFFIFCEMVSFQLSYIVKFIFLSITVLLFHKYFVNEKTASQNFFSSRKTSMILIGIIFLPVLIVIIVNFSGRINGNKQNIDTVVNYVIKNKCDSIARKIIVNRECLITSRTYYFKKSKEMNITLFDRVFMYMQYDAYIPHKWENEGFHRVDFKSFDNENPEINVKKLDSLSKAFNTNFEYYISRPIFNFSGNIAYISISSIFIPEPTGRYAKYEDVFLEKKNNNWRITNK